MARMWLVDHVLPTEEEWVWSVAFVSVCLSLQSSWMCLFFRAMLRQQGIEGGRGKYLPGPTR